MRYGKSSEKGQINLQCKVDWHTPVGNVLVKQTSMQHINPSPCPAVKPLLAFRAVLGQRVGKYTSGAVKHRVARL